MLRLLQSSSSSSSSSSSPQNQNNPMEDLSVLQRQSTAILQRLYQDQEMHSAIDQMPSNGPYRPNWQCNSGRDGTKKRKAEFDVEEEEEETGEEKSEITMKSERENSGTNTCSKVEKQDYIHVRARRGQATDSHSLAERARREKISKKMKCLQDLVPGCNKVTGKAGMLDEIINYVQSLQKQVEFLSMKLATINPRLDFSIDDIFAKEIPAYIASLPAAQFEAACFHYNTMQQGTSNPDISIDQSQFLLQKSGPSSLQIPEMHLDPTFISQLQQLTGLDSDWQSQFNPGFH